MLGDTVVEVCGNPSRPDLSFDVKAELLTEEEIFGSNCGVRSQARSKERENIRKSAEDAFGKH